MKKLFFSLFTILSCALLFNAAAQTNVSGGIFSNTTWTLAGSPYIILDTTVVFQNVTLTIQPGVIVKFNDHKYLEIRQGTLIANGTITDSITFTSNNPTPTAGIWGGGVSQGGIFLNGALPATSFNYCNVSYSTYGISNINGILRLRNSTFTNNSLYGVNTIVNTPVDSCIFRNNGNGISSLFTDHFHSCTIANNQFGIEDCHNTTLTNCTIDSNSVGMGGAAGLGTSGVHAFNCKFRYNQLAFSSKPGACVLNHCVFKFNSPTAVAFGINGVDSLIDSEIKFNGTGVYIRNNSYVTRNVIDSNSVGIELTIADPNIYCNAICNNTSYGLQMNTSSNVNVSNNYWCTPDSASTEVVIYDAYDSPSQGIVSFMPIDTTQCYLTTNILQPGQNTSSISIYPNPVSSSLAIQSKEPIDNITILSIDGREVKSLTIGHSSSINIDLQDLSAGIYFIEVNKNSRQPFVKN